MNNLGTMKAVQLDAPGPPQALHLRDLPIPQPSAGWVRIRVEAFGLNRSELHLRLGLAEGVTFPRVPGIECAGIVDAAPGTSFRPGQQVVAMMGGMGRVFDGGYAQYTVAPASQVIPVRTDLPWEVVGALPEMLQKSAQFDGSDSGVHELTTLLMGSIHTAQMMIMTRTQAEATLARTGTKGFPHVTTALASVETSAAASSPPTADP